MANLFNMITGIKDKVQNNGLFEKITNKNNYAAENMPEDSATPKITPLQYGTDGNVDYEKTLQLKQNTTPRTLWEHLTGRTMTMDTQTTDPTTGETKLETVTNFRPGFFNNLNSGMNENYYNGFDVNNLVSSKKGFGYRVGEMLGTLSRVLAGPLGDAYIAGSQGLDKGMERQNIRTADRIYRDSLAEQGIDTSNLKGYVNSDMYKNATLANYRNNNLNTRQNIAAAKDNTTRAKMILNGFESGMLSEDDAVDLLQHFGIDVGELQPSNKSIEVGMKQELLPHKIKNLDARTNTAYTNANNNTQKTQAYINYLRNGGRSGSRGATPVINNNSGKVKMRYNGKIYNVDANRVQEYEQAGGVRV